jgi:RimJ/RimL family protein N-acetyltransferase
MIIKLVRLENNTSNHSLVQLLLENAPTYSLNVSGEKANATAGKETFEAIPDHFEYSNTHVIGIYSENELIGMIDLLIGYPIVKTAYIGLFLLSEKVQSKGLGRNAYQELESYIGQQSKIDKIRLFYCLLT